MIPGYLIKEDRPTLGELEEVITKGERAFKETGLALAKIRDEKLYLAAGYKTFEKYCRERWGFSRQRAYQQIDAAVLVLEMSTRVDIDLPTNEAQVRPLIGLPVGDAGVTWMCAVSKAGDKPVTGRMVRDAVIKPLVPPKKKMKPLSDALAAFSRAGRQLCDRLTGIDPADLGDEEKICLTETAHLLVKIATEAGCWPSTTEGALELDVCGEVLRDS